MKKIIFAVDENRSYYKSWFSPQVKPNVTLPLVVPLDPGGTIALTFDEIQHTATGAGSDISFTTDQLEPNPGMDITGNLQSIQFIMNSLDLVFDPKTGQISSGSGWYCVHGMPVTGGTTNLCFITYGASALRDGNSSSFDIGNGLGCGGGLVLDVKYYNQEPPTFVLHVEAMVSMEDADGDGTYEVKCPFPRGVPVEVGEFMESVTCMFGVIYGGAGIGVLPNGRIIRIPPRGLSERLYVPIAAGLAEVVRGLALCAMAGESREVESREAIGRSSLDLAEKGLEVMLRAVREERGAAGDISTHIG